VPNRAGIVRSHRDSDAFTIYYGGSLSRETAIVKLIRLASRSRDLRLVLAGDGPLRAFVEKAASSPNVTYLGRVARSTSLELLGGSDLTVVMYEPCNLNNVYACSNKLFEAMMVGVPIVTNKETVMSEIVEGEACGLTVPYYDDVALEQAILSLKQDPALRRKLGDNGRTASQKYCWESVEKRLLLGYKELLHGSNRS
jgi:glycosyltransferase involved in cell wall biosynthesis